LNKKYYCQQQFAEMAGFGFNLKLVLHLQSQCLTESLGFLNPPLLQAAKRWQIYYEKTTKDNNPTIFSSNMFWTKSKHN